MCMMKITISNPWSVVRDGHQVCHIFTKDKANMFIKLLCVYNILINVYVPLKHVFNIVLIFNKMCDIKI